MKKIYQKLKGKPIPTILRNEDGTYAIGTGIVCGYQQNWLILGFNNDYNGCIKEFSDYVHLDIKFPSYRFWNINNLEEYKDAI